MLTQPFLTDIDSRAAIKGSRDPLGVQPIWSRFGRHVVGNLTTVTSSVRDFTVLLLGYYFIERAAEDGATDGDLATFLKWEQLAAYARARINEERGFRGTDRVWARIHESDRVRLGTDSSCQILGNQKIYGLWGLYSVSAKASGLLDGDPPRLTAPAHDLIQRVYLPIFAEAGLRDGRPIVELLRSQDARLDLRDRSKDSAILTAVARVLKTVRAREREIYREHLLYGGPQDANPARGTRGAQRVFADILSETLADPGWRVSPRTVAALALSARGRGPVGESLAERLERIRSCELLIGPAVALFEYALGCDGQTVGEIAGGIQRHWGRTLRGTLDPSATAAIEQELRAAPEDAESGARWIRLAGALHSAQYEDALRIVLEQNAAVMKARSAAAPWCVVRDGKLVVRFRDEQLSALPNGDELPEHWRHAYFIESLRSVARTLRA
jgi:hypothetical protein